MKHEVRYQGRSGIVNGLSHTQMAFAANTLRETTYFDGAVASPVALREGLAALHAVVVSDFTYKPRDRSAFMAWLEEQDRQFLANLGAHDQASRQRMEAIEGRLGELNASRDLRRAPFYRARKAYFEHIYTKSWEIAWLLDPIVSVHPDEVSFEAFSKDESTYARLAAKHDIFANVGSFECGTTNIDFSTALHRELQKMRSYRETRFGIDPDGFSVSHDDGKVHKEKKIDLPDSWVMGMLQVQSTMTMALRQVRLAPVDLFNICRALRRRKAKVSPRALRWVFSPGKRPHVVLEPWEQVIPLTGAAIYEGEADSIRTWGRDRLQTIACLLPKTEHIDVFLAGRGLPSVYRFDLGPCTFTLALSGWTDNDWTGATRFDLLTRRIEVEPDQLERVYRTMQKERMANDERLSRLTGYNVETCRGALSALCQTGRAMYDLGDGGDSRGTYRLRDLFIEPFSVAAATAMVDKAIEINDPKAKEARAIYDSNNVRIIARRPSGDTYKVSGSAQGVDGVRVRPQMHVDADGRIITATCTCKWMKKTKLTKGPCEHILALRLAHMDRLEKTGTSA